MSLLGIIRDPEGWTYEVPEWCVTEGEPVGCYKTWNIRPVFHRVLKPLHRVHAKAMPHLGYVKARLSDGQSRWVKEGKNPL